MSALVVGREGGRGSKEGERTRVRARRGVCTGAGFRRSVRQRSYNNTCGGHGSRAAGGVCMCVCICVYVCVCVCVRECEWLRSSSTASDAESRDRQKARGLDLPTNRYTRSLCTVTTTTTTTLQSDLPLNNVREATPNIAGKSALNYASHRHHQLER